MAMTEEKILDTIEKNMDYWLFDDQHVDVNHINATLSEVQARIGKYDHSGKMRFVASTFLDNANGDDIVAGLTEDLKACSGRIKTWLSSPEKDLELYFSTLPAGVRGMICVRSQYRMPSSSAPIRTFAADRYKIVLRRGIDEPFYLKNAYPIQ